MAKKERSPKTHRKTNEDGTPDRTGMARVELNDDEREQKGRDLASVCKQLEKHVTEKHEFNKRKNGEIRDLEEQVNERSDEVDTGKQWVPSQLALAE